MMRPLMMRAASVPMMKMLAARPAKAAGAPYVCMA